MSLICALSSTKLILRFKPKVEIIQVCLTCVCLKSAIRHPRSLNVLRSWAKRIQMITITQDLPWSVSATSIGYVQSNGFMTIQKSGLNVLKHWNWYPISTYPYFLKTTIHSWMLRFNIRNFCYDSSLHLKPNLMELCTIRRAFFNWYWQKIKWKLKVFHPLILKISQRFHLSIQESSADHLFPFINWKILINVHFISWT